MEAEDRERIDVTKSKSSVRGGTSGLPGRDKLFLGPLTLSNPVFGMFHFQVRVRFATQYPKQSSSLLKSRQKTTTVTSGGLKRRCSRPKSTHCERASQYSVATHEPRPGVSKHPGKLACSTIKRREGESKATKKRAGRTFLRARPTRC